MDHEPDNPTSCPNGMCCENIVHLDILSEQRPHAGPVESERTQLLPITVTVSPVFIPRRCLSAHAALNESSRRSSYVVDLPVKMSSLMILFGSIFAGFSSIICVTDRSLRKCTVISEIMGAIVSNLRKSASVCIVVPMENDKSHSSTLGLLGLH